MWDHCSEIIYANPRSTPSSHKRRRVPLETGGWRGSCADGVVKARRGPIAAEFRFRRSYSRRMCL
jgi:hypothetical protein